MGIACRRSLLLCLVVIDDCDDWGGIGSWLSEMSVDCDPASRRDDYSVIIIFCLQVPDSPLRDILDSLNSRPWTAILVS